LRKETAVPSSTSNSDAIEVRPGFVRLTASDRPGVAEPVPERDIPPMAWGPIWLGALALLLVLFMAWEWHWRAFGAEPGYRNSDGQWAQQRRRINQGEGGKTVLVGSSRVLFDVQLPVWEKTLGERPIQLALEGTSPLPVLEDLAADPDFTGRLVIGVAPDLFFSGFKFRGDVIEYTKNQGPSQRSGTWISQTFLEPYFAFYDADFALGTVLERQNWPLRPGMTRVLRVRKLSVTDLDRNTRMWSKLLEDPGYVKIARDTWAVRFTGPPPPFMNTPEKLQNTINTQLDQVVAALATLRARGVKIVFLRPPSNGDYYAHEQRVFPRARTWDVLLERTGLPGIHFEDHPQLQGYDLPEWSHLSGPEADRFTAAVAPLIEAEFNNP
jgi:hypothetical protein